MRITTHVTPPIERVGGFTYLNRALQVSVRLSHLKRLLTGAGLAAATKCTPTPLLRPPSFPDVSLPRSTYKILPAVFTTRATLPVVRTFRICRSTNEEPPNASKLPPVNSACFSACLCLLSLSLLRTQVQANPQKSGSLDLSISAPLRCACLTKAAEVRVAHLSAAAWSCL